MNNEGKILLNVNSLTKYFELKKTKMFQKEIPTLKANDGISLDIIEGETLGLVGESGCGKSTFGRVLLQLYPQTAGSVYYSGKTIYDQDYGYVKDVLNNYAKRVKKIREVLYLNDVYDLSTYDHSEYVDYALKTKKFKNIDELTLLAKIGGSSVLLDDEGVIKAQELIHELYNANKSKSDTTQIESKLAELKAKVKDHSQFAYFESLMTSAVDISRLTVNEIRPIRKDLQIIFQDPFSSLNPRMSVGQIIAEGLTAHGMFKRGSAELDAYIKEIMKKCGLEEYFIHRYPHQFSGGQRQRIGIARALALQPKFIVCDEAVSALDVSIQSQILNLLRDLKEENDLTYLFITHDLSVVKYISDRIGVMYLGNMCELGSSKQIFDNPLHPYTKALLEVVPTTEEKAKAMINTLEGDIPSPINPPRGCKFRTRCPKAMEICSRVEPEWKAIEPGHFVACHLHNEQ